MKYQDSFECEARSQSKFSDGSGETAIWSDGLMLSTLDSMADNHSTVRLVHEKKYKVTITIEEI